MLKTGAIIPAAGFSSRMGECKPLMDLNGTKVIEKIVTTFKSSGIDDIIVVTGHKREDVEKAAQKLKCKTVYNENYRDGMFSSVQTALKSVPGNWGYFFFLPTDIPLVREKTIKSILDKRTEGKTVIYPMFRGRRGHPPLINRSIIGRALSWEGPNGLRGVLDLYEEESQDIEIIDEGISLDMDTHEDYDRIVSIDMRRDLPTRHERLAMEDMADTPLNVLEHERRVALTALKLADLAREAHIDIDIDLLESASMVHDICRTSKSHAQAGADFLRDHGFNEVAELTETHMDYPYDGKIDEGALLYMADKLSCEDRFCFPQERLSRMLIKFDGSPKAQKSAIRRLKKAMKMIDDLSDLTGKDVLEELQK